ncbi:MAG: hydrogen peroxide-inducible genes activator [Bacteroidota bacterium]|nr:hydrogen peroxide-inducible genes activator [Bacteroidota bacterium]
MNIQQLEYVIAVDTYRHFVKAAEKCFVTQATLSMMIKKLEEELDVKIFDRSRQPVVPTEIGIKIIAQAKIIVRENNRLKEMVHEEQGELKGELRIGIIPTLAPYLLPLFMNSFLKKYPSVKLKISEFTTNQIIHKLEQHGLDAGLLSTPLNQPSLREEPLFYEQFVVYASSGEKILKKKFVLANDIDVNRLCLLEEGHCLRSQVFNLCELRNKEQEFRQLDFETGSIETLKRIVEVDQGITILPILALKAMTAKQKQNIRYFKEPVPVREVGLVTYRYFVKEKLIQSLKDEILSNIPAEMRSLSKKEIINI